MKLFKKIWHKAFRKGENPEKLADDLGKLRGYVTLKKYDPFTGRILSETTCHNTLVNQAKSSLIRLISQGQSNWVGQINPSDFKISRMRFSNNFSMGTPSQLLYYDIAEPSVRPCVPLPGASGTRFAGGGPNDEIGAQTQAYVEYEVQNIPGNYIVGATNNIKIFTIRNATIGGTPLTDHPPSHSGINASHNFKVQLYNGSTLVETIYFYDPDDLTDFHVYARQAQNPHVVVSETGGEVMAPSGRPHTPVFDPSKTSRIININDHSATYLFYDYTDKCWKFQLEEISPLTTVYTKIKFVYVRGAYNIINSIVPRNGYNVGSGTTPSTRYSGMTMGDYYPILPTLEYRDGDIDLVDDYSVTFSVNMAGQYGNGITTLANQYIRYREAYLFNARDELFSALFLPSNQDFEKNPFTAYYVAWTIVAPIG